MKHERFLAFLGLCAMATLAGCTQETAEPSPPTSPAASPPPTTADSKAPTATAPPPPSTPLAESVSIYDLLNPKSTIKPATGDVLTIAGPNLRVTAISGAMVYLQEAGDSGACDQGSAVVAYRAIRVRTYGIPNGLRRGMRVKAEGALGVRFGRRELMNAALTIVPGDIHEYTPHCERDPSALLGPELENVLVTTAGQSTMPPDAQAKTWSLASCAGASFSIGSTMSTYDDWTAHWHRVTGVVAMWSTGRILEPRDRADIDASANDDACM